MYVFVFVYLRLTFAYVFVMFIYKHSWFIKARSLLFLTNLYPRVHRVFMKIKGDDVYNEKAINCICSPCFFKCQKKIVSQSVVNCRWKWKFKTLE